VSPVDENLVDENLVGVEPVARDLHSRSRRLRILAAVGIGAATLTVASLVATSGSEKATLVAPPLGDEAPTTTLAHEPLSDTSRLRLDGIGPVWLGMSLDEASSATGQAIRVDPRTDRGRGCAHAIADGGPPNLRFMVVNGRIARVEAGPGPVRTLAGVGAGSTEAEVLAAYPDRIRVQPNPYTGHLGGKDLIYMPDEASRHLSMLFEVSDGRVRTFRSGWDPAVMAPEGCS